MTKQAFLDAYRAELLTRYPWAQDQEKLTRFMASVAETLNGGGSWNREGEASTAAWRAIGGKGKPTYKALQALA